MDYNIGDIIIYRTFGGTARKCRVEYREKDVKNGLPGFDAIIIEGPDRGMSVWGYDDQIVEVI